MPTTTGFATDLITFSRGSLATVTDSNGYIKWAPHNLLLASEQFDASSWLKTVFTVSANTSVAPNGTTTADTLNEGTANSFRALDGAVTTISGANYTVGIFLKYVDARYINITLFNNSTGSLYSAVCFDVQNGAVASSNAAGTGYAIVGTPSITSVGNNWYYCSFVATVGSTTANYVGISTNNTNTFSNYGYPATFTGTSRTVYLWGAHLYRSDLGGMQANASAYPYYNPSTPKNLLGYSEAFDNAAWVKQSGVTVTVNAVSAPNGSLSADQIDFASNSVGIYQVVTVITSKNYKFSAWVRADTTGTITLAQVSGGIDATLNLTSSWQRIEYTINSLNASNGPYFYKNASDVSRIYLWGAQLSDSASLDPYVGSYGAAPSPAAAYGPRLDYDPSTLAAKGLLVEEQRTNLALWSSDFRDTTDAGSSRPWVYTNVTITADAIASPDGTSNAEKIIATSTSGVHTIVQNLSVTSGSTYTLSVMLKAGGETTASVIVSNSPFPRVKFDLSAGTITSSQDGGVGAIMSLGNGWYRCSMTFSAPAASINIGVAIRDIDNNWSGNGVDGIFAYGAQLEAGAFATSYIPTAAATVTRNADVASVATSQFPYSATEGTLVLAADVLATTSANRFGALLSSPSNFIGVGNNIGGSGGVYAEFFVSISGVTQAYLAFNNAVAANTLFKVAGSYKADDFAASANGATALTDTTGSVPTDIDTLQIGRYYSSSYFNGHIRQITYIPRRLTNAELIARST